MATEMLDCGECGHVLRDHNQRGCTLHFADGDCPCTEAWTAEAVRVAEGGRPRQIGLTRAPAPADERLTPTEPDTARAEWLRSRGASAVTAEVSDARRDWLRSRGAS